MQTLFTRSLLLLLLTVLLAGCGFNLRNSNALAQQGPIYLAGIDQYEALYRTLKHSMTAAGVTLSPSKQQAKSVLNMRDHGETQQVITVDSRGKATEYMLIRKVTVNLQTPGGKELVGDQEVGVRRNWIEAGKTGLAGYREAAELREEMLQELSMSILRVLDYSLR